jgi:ankyrin repeat protein
MLNKRGLLISAAALVGLAALSSLGLLSSGASWALSPKSWLDPLILRTQKDPSLINSYAWPSDVSFEAILDLPHINNYPAFARVGARGKVRWQPQNILVELTEISHAAQRNVWFDCSELNAVRVGLAHDSPYDDRGSNANQRWSAWQAVSIPRTGPGAYSSKGQWTFDIAANGLRDIWAARMALEVRCTVRGGKSFEHRTLSRAAWPARAAHALALAPNPCSQALNLQNAIGMQCEDALKTRLASAWGRAEARRLAHADQHGQDNASWLDLAITERMPQAIEPLVKAGVSPNTLVSSDQESPLIYAAGNGDAAAVRELLRLGARKDHKDTKGFTAYNAAAYSGHGELALELAEQGVQRDTASGPAYTALSLAAYQQDTAAVRRLLESGSHPDEQPGGWRNPLHHAAASGNIELARTLLAGGANPDAGVSARRGETPLMIAAEMGHVPMMELLLKYGAQLNTIDKMGKNATDYAEFFRKASASDFLCSKGLQPTALDASAKNGETAKRATCQQGSVGRR